MSESKRLKLILLWLGCCFLSIFFIFIGDKVNSDNLLRYLREIGFAIIAGLAVAVINHITNSISPNIIYKDKYRTTMSKLERAVVGAKNEIIIYNTWLNLEWSRKLKEVSIANNVKVIAIFASWKEGSFLYNRFDHTRHLYRSNSSFKKRYKSFEDNIRACVIGDVNFLLRETEDHSAHPVVKFYSGYAPGLIAKIDSSIFWIISPLNHINISKHSIVCTDSIHEPVGKYWVKQLEIINNGEVGRNKMTHSIEEEVKFLDVVDNGEGQIDLGKK